MRPVVYTATATDVTNGYTPMVVVDYLRINGQYGLQYLTSGGAAGTGAVQQSMDDPFANAQTAMTWAPVTIINGRMTVNEAVRAFQVASPALGDVFTVVTQGTR